MDRQLCFLSYTGISRTLCRDQLLCSPVTTRNRGGAHEETVTGLTPALIQIKPTASKESPVVITLRSEHFQ